MQDELYVMMQDIKERKAASTGVFHKKGGSKSKKCTLPSDYLTKKEREKMNGEVKVWNMNEFYTWEEFKKMPRDIQAAYISTVSQKYNIGIYSISKYLFKLSSTGLKEYIVRKNLKPELNLTNGSKSIKAIREFQNAIEEAKNPREENFKNVFIPDGMAPGFEEKETLKKPVEPTVRSISITMDGLDYTVLDQISKMFGDNKICVNIHVYTIDSSEDSPT